MKMLKDMMQGKLEGVDLIHLLESQFESLSPQLKIAARYIVSAPQEVAVYSMREIASRAQVKPATMVRLANRFGYENYNTFRDTFRESVTPPASGYAARARELQLRRDRKAASGLLSEFREAELENIERTYSDITDSALEKSAAACVDAEKVFVVGLRKCFSVASFFHYATRVFFRNSKLIQGCAGLFREEIEGITEKDLVLAIAFEPYTRETVETTKLAKERGCKVIAVTDSSVSPLAKNADFVFLVANRSPSFYRSLSGALSVVQALVAAIVTHLGESAVQALEQSDASLRSSNTYWYN